MVAAQATLTSDTPDAVAVDDDAMDDGTLSTGVMESGSMGAGSTVDLIPESGSDTASVARSCGDSDVGLAVAVVTLCDVCGDGTR